MALLLSHIAFQRFKNIPKIQKYSKDSKIFQRFKKRGRNMSQTSRIAASNIEKSMSLFDVADLVVCNEYPIKTTDYLSC